MMQPALIEYDYTGNEKPEIKNCLCISTANFAEEWLKHYNLLLLQISNRFILRHQ
jgi:hypothetical protein